MPTIQIFVAILVTGAPPGRVLTSLLCVGGLLHNSDILLLSNGTICIFKFLIFAPHISGFIANLILFFG